MRLESQGSESSSSVEEGGDFRSASMQGTLRRDQPEKTESFWSTSNSQQKLIGRSKDLKTLRGAFHDLKGMEIRERCAIDHGRTAFILVEGSTGCGKSHLTKSLQDEVKSSGDGFFLVCRFDQYMREGFDSLFSTAFEYSLKAEGAENKDGAVALINEAVSDVSRADMNTLMGYLPSIEKIMGKKEFETSIQSSLSDSHEKYPTNRQSSVLDAFLEGVSRTRPVVMLLENLQWVDPKSIERMTSLVSSLRRERVLFIGTCRDDVVDDVLFKEIESKRAIDAMLENLIQDGIRCETIHLKNLKRDKTVALVATSLKTTNMECRDIADLIYTVASGNPLHCLELVASLTQFGILRYSDRDQVWEVVTEEQADTEVPSGSTGSAISTMLEQQLESKVDHLHRIRKDLDCESVLGLLRQRLQKQSTSIQEMLKVAACLGMTIDEKLLATAMSAPVEAYIAAATTSGFIIGTIDGYRFASNKVQQAAYSLIPDNDRKRHHLAIGRMLLKRIDWSETDAPSHLLLSQFMIGLEMVTNPKEKYAVAAVLLSLGQKSAKASDFVAASRDLEQAMDLLPRNHWREDHELSLALYNALAETKYTLGDHSRSRELVDQILEHSRCQDEELQAYSTKICTLLAQDRFEDALDLGLSVLRDLGDGLPAHPTKRRVFMSYLYTRRLLQRKTDEQLLTLPHLQNPRKVASMQILNLLFTTAFLARPLLAPLISSKMVQIMLKHGICAVSSYGIGTFGMLECSYGGRALVGYNYGQVSLQLMEKFGAKEWLPRVYAAVYGCINAWSQPMESILKPLLVAVRVGCETGDNEFAMLNANIHSFSLFGLGVPLSQMQEEMQRMAGEMRSLNQLSMLKMNTPFRYILNQLMEQSEQEELEPDDQRVREEVDCGTHSFLDCWNHAQKCIVAFLFCDYDLAASEARRAEEIRKGAPYQSVDHAYIALFCALSLLAVYKRLPRREQRLSWKMVLAHMRFIARIAENAPSYCMGKLFLLRAEMAVCRGRHKGAYSHYTASIALSSKGKHLLEEGIANERAGRYKLATRDSSLARHHFQEAVEVYSKWGATKKVRMLQTEMKSLDL